MPGIATWGRPPAPEPAPSPALKLNKNPPKLFPVALEATARDPGVVHGVAWVAMTEVGLNGPQVRAAIGLEEGGAKRLLNLVGGNTIDSRPWRVARC